jgi:uncharacterized protein YqgC (DUF456 family)
VVDSADVIAGLVIAVGLAGIVVPLLPGTLLVAAAVLFWAVAVAQPWGWVAAGVALAVLAVGAVVKYVVPHRGLREHGVPTRTLLLGGLLGVVGFFVVPVVGLVLGFVLGVYLSELQRVGAGPAWPATKAAVRAVGLSVLIELAAAVLAASVWAVGAAVT